MAAKLDKSGMGYDNSVFMTFDTIYKLANSDIVSENLDKENLEKYRIHDYDRGRGRRVSRFFRRGSSRGISGRRGNLCMYSK